MSHFALTLSFYFWRFVCLQTTVFQPLSSPFIPLGNSLFPINSTPVSVMTRLSPDLCLLICKEPVLYVCSGLGIFLAAVRRRLQSLLCAELPWHCRKRKLCLRHIRGRALSTERSWVSFGGPGLIGPCMRHCVIRVAL